MNDEHYSSPQSVIVDDRTQDIPEDILKKIRGAWIAGLISVALTAVFTLISIYGTDIMGLDAWAFVDVGLMAILTFGVYKKSRVSAVLLLALFIANKLVFWVESGTISGLPVTLVFIYFYGRGVMGTFQYHQLLKQQPA